MGFNIATRYRLNPDQQLLSSQSLSRCGSSVVALVFDGVIGDLVPTGRQTDLTVGFTHQLNQAAPSGLRSPTPLTAKHYQGLHDTHVMLTYSGRF